MNSAIWIQIISSAAMLIATIITVIWGNKKNAERSKEQTELTLYRIGELEKKQDKYNHIQERTTKLEKDVAVIKEDIKAVNERMTYLHEE